MKIFFLPNKNKFRNPKVWVGVWLASKYGKMFHAVHQYIASNKSRAPKWASNPVSHICTFLSVPIPNHYEIGRPKVKTPLPLKNLREKCKMDMNLFHICENPITCQTLINDLLCTRHGIWSKAPQICTKHDSCSQKTYYQLKFKELIIMTLIQIHHP